MKQIYKEIKSNQSIIWHDLVGSVLLESNFLGLQKSNLDQLGQQKRSGLAMNYGLQGAKIAKSPMVGGAFFG